MKHLLIVGAGISGLSFAHYLLEKRPDYQITFLEKTGRVGGWLQTCKEGGLSYEKGPRFFAKHKSPHLLSLIKTVGLEKELLYADTSASKRWIYENKKLLPLPSSFWSFCTSPLTRGALLPLAREYFQGYLPAYFQKKPPDFEETVDAFLFRRFRSKKLIQLTAAMAKGIYASDIQKLSTRLSFPALVDLEKKHGSLVKGMLRQPKKDTRLFTLKGGMGTLTHALQQALQKTGRVSWHFGEELLQIEGKHAITTSQRYLTDHMVFALPLSSIQQLFPKSPWTKLNTHSLHIVHCAWDSSILPHKGFGYLTGGKEDTPILGAVFDSCMYGEKKGEKLSIFLGGEQAPEVATLPQKDLERLALHSLQEHLGIAEPPTQIAFSLGKNAGVSFRVGHDQQVEKGLKSLPNHISLLGNYLQGVSVDHCIQRALQEVDHLVKKPLRR
ncbi:MAG: protoporphyrinogen oxidase [Chlamydiota bacterium]